MHKAEHQGEWTQSNAVYVASVWITLDIGKKQEKAKKKKE
jgi:hypothetical protein